jgi:hypothetical protein
MWFDLNISFPFAVDYQEHPLTLGELHVCHRPVLRSEDAAVETADDVEFCMGKVPDSGEDQAILFSALVLDTDRARVAGQVRHVVARHVFRRQGRLGLRVGGDGPLRYRRRILRMHHALRLLTGQYPAGAYRGEDQRQGKHPYPNPPSVQVLLLVRCRVGSVRITLPEPHYREVSGRLERSNLCPTGRLARLQRLRSLKVALELVKECRYECVCSRRDGAHRT